jgi:hypothetical protein
MSRCEVKTMRQLFARTNRQESQIARVKPTLLEAPIIVLSYMFHSALTLGKAPL